MTRTSSWSHNRKENLGLLLWSRNQTAVLWK